MSTDYLVLVDISKDIDSVLNQCEYAFFPKIHYEGKRIYNLIKKTSKIFWLKPMKGMGFSMNMPDTYGGGNYIVRYRYELSNPYKRFKIKFLF